MNYSENQSVYYVPYVRLKMAVSLYGLNLIGQKGDEFPLDIENDHKFDHTHHFVMIPANGGVNIVAIGNKEVELFVKILIPKFKIGDIVRDNRYPDTIPFTIMEYTVIHGKIWYRNKWSVKTGDENGNYEEFLQLTKEKVVEHPQTVTLSHHELYLYMRTAVVAYSNEKLGIVFQPKAKNWFADWFGKNYPHYK